MKKILISFIIMILSCFNIISANTSKGTTNCHWTATYYGNTYKTQRHTANGEVFNMHSMTCAAPTTYEFGTMLKVTNLANNKSVVVRVTDRGHLGNGKNGHNVIDLTYGAFAKIANHSAGRIKIRVEVVK